MLTVIGICVPDVVWVNADRRSELESKQPLVSAPDICIEIVSPANTVDELSTKTRAYLDAGAREVIWLDPQTRAARFFSHAGETAGGQFGLRLEALFDQG